MAHPLFPDVTVNGVPIAQAAIAAEAQNHDAPAGKPGLAWRKAARALILRELLFQEADKRGLTPAPQTLGAGQRETEDEARARAALEACITIDTPQDDAVRAAWAQDPTRFRAPPLWEVSHILCAADPEDPDARDRARSRATALADALVKDPKSFGRLARDNSACGSKSNGGALGQLGPGDTVPEFEAVLRRLAEGAITARPVASRFGYHIIRMDAVAQGDVLPFSAVAPKLKEAMEKTAWVKAVHALGQKLVDQARIDGIDVTAF